MRKRVIGFFLMLCLIAMTVMPVMAEGKDIQPAIDAYDEMKEVLINQVGDVDTLEAAVNKMTATNEELELEYEDFDALEAHDPDYWKVMLQADAIVRMSDVLDAYAQNKNGSTALEVVNLYEQLEPDYGQLLAGWFSDIAGIYDDAKQNAPSGEVIDVYEAYVNVQNAMIFGYDADFVSACEEFEAVLEIYNDLSEDDMNALAALIGVENGEEAFNKILSDWINANMILELGELYDAYSSNPNKDTAKALVEMYDALFGATDMFLPEDMELFRNAVAGIDDVYEDAKALLDSGASEDGSEEDESKNNGSEEDESKKDEAKKDVVKEDETDRNASPKTGDASDMMMIFVTMMAAAGLIVATIKKKA